MIALLALQAALATDSLMGPGDSLELARYRAERVADVRYELALDVTRRDTVIGRPARTPSRTSFSPSGRVPEWYAKGMVMPLTIDLPELFRDALE